MQVNDLMNLSRIEMVAHSVFYFISKRDQFILKDNFTHNLAFFAIDDKGLLFENLNYIKSRSVINKLIILIANYYGF